jgi:hypothetical protein
MIRGTDIFLNLMFESQFLVNADTVKDYFLL